MSDNPSQVEDGHRISGEIYSDHLTATDSVLLLSLPRTNSSQPRRSISLRLKDTESFLETASRPGTPSRRATSSTRSKTTGQKRFSFAASASRLMAEGSGNSPSESLSSMEEVLCTCCLCLGEYMCCICDMMRTAVCGRRGVTRSRSGTAQRGNGNIETAEFAEIAGTARSD